LTINVPCEKTPQPNVRKNGKSNTVGLPLAGNGIGAEVGSGATPSGGIGFDVGIETLGVVIGTGPGIALTCGSAVTPKRSMKRKFIPLRNTLLPPLTTTMMRVPNALDDPHATPGRNSGESVAGCAVKLGWKLNVVTTEGSVIPESLSLHAMVRSSARPSKSKPNLGRIRAIAHLARDGKQVSCENRRMSDADLKAELERLKAENEQLKTQRGRSTGLKVSEKGGVSVYGLGRFPVTLYKEQWAKLLGMADEIRAFIKENDANLKTKPE
jgi:hypothetical protein